MELVFQEKQVQYLNRILHETVSMEQTADLIVPDSMSDVDRVVDAFATALVRTQECSATGVFAEGVAQTGIIFVGADGNVQHISAQIPFSVRRELPSMQENCTLQCKCAVRSVDARALNSRKLLVRVGISCMLTAYAPGECTCYDLPEAAANLQLKRREFPLTVPVGLGEKNFVLNEELELPNSKPLIERLLKCVYQTQLAEQKIVGDKAVFKGNLRVHALYESMEEKLVSFEWNVPFSQYATLPQEFEDGDLQTELGLMSAETEADLQANRLLLSAQLLAQCTVFGRKKLTIIDDAFCTDAELEPQYRPCEMVGILDRQTLRENAALSSDEAVGNVVDAWVYPEDADRRRTDENVRLEVPLNCNILYYDEDGALQGKTLRPSVQVETALCEQGNCNVTQIDSGEIFCDAAGGTLRVRVPVAMTLESSATHRFNAVTGGEITQSPSKEERSPSLILRRLDEDEELWHIAKACRTPMQSILEANGLQDETVPAGTMLLIPL